jgi:hypothetical protein
MRTNHPDDRALAAQGGLYDQCIADDTDEGGLFGD